MNLQPISNTLDMTMRRLSVDMRQDKSAGPTTASKPPVSVTGSQNSMTSRGARRAKAIENASNATNRIRTMGSDTGDVTGDHGRNHRNNRVDKDTNRKPSQHAREQNPGNSTNPIRSTESTIPPIPESTQSKTTYTDTVGVNTQQNYADRRVSTPHTNVYTGGMKRVGYGMTSDVGVNDSVGVKGNDGSGNGLLQVAQQNTNQMLSRSLRSSPLPPLSPVPQQNRYKQVSRNKSNDDDYTDTTKHRKSKYRHNHHTRKGQHAVTVYEMNPLPHWRTKIIGEIDKDLTLMRDLSKRRRPADPDTSRLMIREGPVADVLSKHFNPCPTLVHRFGKTKRVILPAPSHWNKPCDVSGALHDGRDGFTNTSVNADNATITYTVKPYGNSNNDIHSHRDDEWFDPVMSFGKASHPFYHIRRQYLHQHRHYHSRVKRQDRSSGSHDSIISGNKDNHTEKYGNVSGMSQRGVHRFPGDGASFSTRTTLPPIHGAVAHASNDRNDDRVIFQHIPQPEFTDIDLMLIQQPVVIYLKVGKQKGLRKGTHDTTDTVIRQYRSHGGASGGGHDGDGDVSRHVMRGDMTNTTPFVDTHTSKSVTLPALTKDVRRDHVNGNDDTHQPVRVPKQDTTRHRHGGRDSHE